MATISFNTINVVDKKDSKNFEKLLSVKKCYHLSNYKVKSATPARITKIRKSMSAH